MTLSEIVAKNLKQRLEENNVSVKNFAILIGVTRPTATHYLSGESRIEAIVLYKIAQYFNKTC